MPFAPSDAKRIFGQALEIESARERSHYLDVACGRNAQLRAEVEDLLSALAQAEGEAHARRYLRILREHMPDDSETR
jgi:hypothetical protein